MRYFLIAIRAWPHSISQSVCLAASKMVKNCFNRFVKQEMNRPRAASQSLYSFSGGRSMRFYNDLELNRIGLNPPPHHHEAKEFTRTNSKGTL